MPLIIRWSLWYDPEIPTSSALLANGDRRDRNRNAMAPVRTHMNCQGCESTFKAEAAKGARPRRGSCPSIHTMWLILKARIDSVPQHESHRLKGRRALSLHHVSFTQESTTNKNHVITAGQWQDDFRSFLSQQESMKICWKIQQRPQHRSKFIEQEHRSLVMKPSILPTNPMPCALPELFAYIQVQGSWHFSYDCESGCFVLVWLSCKRTTSNRNSTAQPPSCMASNSNLDMLRTATVSTRLKQKQCYYVLVRTDPAIFWALSSGKVHIGFEVWSSSHLFLNSFFLYDGSSVFKPLRNEALENFKSGGLCECNRCNLQHSKHATPINTLYKTSHLVFSFSKLCLQYLRHSLEPRTKGLSVYASWLGCIWDCTTQLYWDYFITHYKD